jgi:hypothetical protein
VHGITNQPASERLLTAWKRDLADGGDGLDLDVVGVTSSMVYWADVMYAGTSDAGSEHESIEYEGLEPGALTEIDESYIGSASPEERAFLEAMIAAFGLDTELGEPTVRDLVPPDDREAVPLPWFVKRPLMRVLLRDVHHYLFNAAHSPRPGAHYRVRDEIRSRFVADLEANATRPHLVVGHSLGSVIAYDCLKRVPGCPPVDLLVTLGSPLGLSEVQDRLTPEWSRTDGYPGGLPNWVNVSDRLDPVCIDPRLANDYRRGGERVVDDVIVSNPGAFRHPSGKYFRQQATQRAIREGLGL